MPHSHPPGVGENIVTTVTAVVLLATAALLIRNNVDNIKNQYRRRQYLSVVRAVRWWMLPAGVGAVFAVGATIVALNMWGPPWMKWGWMYLLGGNGNAFVGGGLLPDNYLIPMVMAALLAAAAPNLALTEELAFRYADQERGMIRRAGSILVFGMCHMVVGVPIGVGLALCVGGIYFTIVYRVAYANYPQEPVRTRDATSETIEWPKPSTMMTDSCVTSAAAHAVYNWIVTAILFGSSATAWIMETIA